MSPSELPVKKNDSARNNQQMHPGYRIRNQEGIYFITFAVIEWIDVFTRKEYAEIVIESLIVSTRQTLFEKLFNYKYLFYAQQQ